jgi:hypothetical protein
MDALSSALLVELIAAAVGDALRSTMRLHRAADERTAFMRAERAEDPALTDAIELAVERLLDVEAIDEALGGERLRTFLQSLECRRAIVPLFGARKLVEPPLPLLRESFVASLRQHTGAGGEQATQAGARLFDVLVDGASAALTHAAGRGITAATVAQRVFSDRMLADQLANVERNLALLQRPDAPSQETIGAFVEAYRRQVAQREGSILPPDFDRQRKRSLDALYVPPQLAPGAARGDGDEERSCTYDAFLERVDRTVVLGDPGGGKSTLTKRIATDVCTLELPPLLGALAAAPSVAVRVTLRAYGARKQQHGCSLLEFVEEQARSRYQMPTVPTGVFEYLLRNGHALVLLDGLDELTDTSYRREISADVESFATLFPATPMLVTSRQVGYDEAPLDDGRFQRFGLAPFDEEQVRTYAAKAFSLDEPAPVQVDSELVASFMTESEAVADLRSNAMLLGLMCNLYRGQGYIPANRPDVYEKCAVMLFERWDQQRGIRAPLPFESRLRPAMQHLAHWIFEEPGLEDGVTYARLVEKTTEYLHERRFPDLDEAREAAVEFVELCRGRAWVFTDIGTTATGEPLFQFTHRTFLEYFTAQHVVRTHPTPEALATFMLPKVGRREWDVVLQLAAQIQSRNVEDSSDALVRLLLDDAHGPRGANTIAFACALLSSLVPFPQTTVDVTISATERVVEALADWPWDDGDLAMAAQRDVAGIMRELVNAGPETRELVSATLTEQLVGHARRTRNLAVVDLACDVAFWLRVERFDGLRLWELASARARDALLPLRLELAKDDEAIASDLVLSGDLELATFAEHHAPHALFAPRQQRYGMVLRAPVLGIMLSAYADTPSSRSRYRERHIALFPQVAALLRQSPPPWYHPDDEYAFYAGHSPRPGWLGRSWTRDATFVAFAVLAVGAEVDRRWDWEPATLAPASDVLTHLWRLIAAPDEDETNYAELMALFDEQDARFVSAWLSGEIELTASVE